MGTPHRLVFREFLRLEGLGDYDTTVCPTDGCIHRAVYRCRDCHDDQLYCKDCIVAAHQRNPYHHILVSCTIISIRFYLRHMHVPVLERIFL